MQENKAGVGDGQELRRNPVSKLRRNQSLDTEEYNFPPNTKCVLVEGNPELKIIVSSSLTSKEVEALTGIVTQHQKKVNDAPRKTDRKYHWCESIRFDHEKGYDLWASCDLHGDVCDRSCDEAKSAPLLWGHLSPNS